MTWSVGDRVRHPGRPDWGVGEVIKVSADDKVSVYFESAGSKLLKAPPLIAAVGAEVVKPLHKKPLAGPKGHVSHRSIEEYTAAFLEQFPRGFYDPKYADWERDYKLEASQLLAKSLSRATFRRLLEDQPNEVCRLALKVIGKTNLIFPYEQMELRDGLQSAGAKRRFACSLFELIHGDGDFPFRFDSFAAVLTDINAGNWPVATYFPFLARPREHILLKPLATKRIAAACGVELNYRSEPNSLTYKCLLVLTRKLFEVLSDLRPRDMIDVQSFIWTVARG